MQSVQRLLLIIERSKFFLANSTNSSKVYSFELIQILSALTGTYEMLYSFKKARQESERLALHGSKLEKAI